MRRNAGEICGAWRPSGDGDLDEWRSGIKRHHDGGNVADSREEARASAAIIGAELIWLDYHDEFLYENEKVRLRYIDLVRQARPDVIITHDPQTDYHPDHLTDRAASVEYTSDGRCVDHQNRTSGVAEIPDLYFMDTIGGINFQPQDYVDITATMDQKRKMLSQHVSQIEFMKKRYDMTLVEFMEICTAFRGLQASVRYAECFRRSMTFPANYQRVLP